MQTFIHVLIAVQNELITGFMQVFLYPCPKQARSEIDEDGFFEGEVCGRVGLVPVNMVEEITSPEELSQVPELLAAQAERKKELGEADEGGERGV